ncbi:MAG: tetratricopeptide (TPR) repeat protein [Bacteroidia bacterium]|jgi:tetratricopeptide (TPR) repeat protein
MRHTIKRNLFLIGLALTSVMVTAQTSNIETVKMGWISSADEDKTVEDVHLRIDELLEAIEEAKVHVKTANHFKMWYYRGYTYLKLSNDGSADQKAKYPNSLDIATESFFKSIETDVKGKLIELSKQQLVNCAVGHYNRGVASFNAKDYDAALASYETVLKIFPYDKDEFLTKQAQINKETIVLYSAYSASGSGNNAKAKMLIQQLIDNAYGDPRIYSEMANILLEEKDTTGALKYIAQGREMYEEDANLMRAEIELFMNLGRSEELIEKLNAAIKIEPESAVLHFARAMNYYNIGNDKEAELSYLKVVEVDETYYDANYNLGVIYLDRCKPIAEKIETMDYDEGLKYESEIDILYAKAAKQFQVVFDNTDYTNKKEEQIGLAKNLKKLYGRLKQNDKTGTYQPKYDEMKAIIKSAGG